MKRIFILVLFLSFTLVPKIGAQLFTYPGTGISKVDLVTYVTTTATLITVSWEPSVGATEYEIELFSVNRNAVVVTSKTTATEMSIIPPFQGIFIVSIRATAINAEGTTDYSEWASSDNPTFSTVDGIERGWWIYAFIAPPGEIQ
jgi:hypothetical protein